MEKDTIQAVGIFFDGTGNNGINAGSSDIPFVNNESYKGAPTNIYKLYNLFNGNSKIYVEGIGTVTGGEDSNFAMATCANPPDAYGYSSDDKLQKASDFVRNVVNDKTVDYHFYIYGFSRGSMLAREFCNQLATDYPSVNVTIKFLGVFDTVESKPFNTYDMSLPQEVENALHLCAVNECRFFFPLTGFFENSKNMQNTKTETAGSVWKEIFVPGAHADIGGGYLQAPQSVYISTDFINTNDLQDYVADVRNAKTDAEGNKIWDSLLSDFQIEKGVVLSQAYVSRELVFNTLPFVYGRIMLEETNNAVSGIFSTDLTHSGLEIGEDTFLADFYTDLAAYVKSFLPAMKPYYNYADFAKYTHISANFGLYQNDVLLRSADEIEAELINIGLNVPSSTSIDRGTQTRLLTELHLSEDSFVVDFLYGTNVPNNDIWSRTIGMKSFA
ncbi:T6SS phospholipase effector Tle1-like catalytic domain-containing protein [Chryseobacterium sp. MIQD13]|uniref:T6SS phospholipase effector Tle1-like catalytic domain-containing protein n=1 Tax=Chryseobacterium sp. MIQD13 TaxID=3422310 RepID=UPI003D271A66